MKQPTNVTYLVITFPYLTINLNQVNRAFCQTILKTKLRQSKMAVRILEEVL